MKNAPAIVAAIAASLALTACTGARPSIPRAAIDRALSSAPYAAQPSLVVAREIAFARAARENGQWTAFRAFAADDAVIHGRNGPVSAKPLLATLSDPEKPVQWSPRTVMMSCDGKMAVSAGRFRDPEGLVGNFVTVWERDGFEGDYEWSYDVAGLDDPQPAPVEQEEGAIVVTAYDAVQGLVADCPPAGTTIDAPTPLVWEGALASGESRSPDGTLVWQWGQFDNGLKRVQARFWKDGAWQKIVDRRLESPPE